jgi:hypothetical protein
LYSSRSNNADAFSLSENRSSSVKAIGNQNFKKKKTLKLKAPGFTNDKINEIVSDNKTIESVAKVKF